MRNGNENKAMQYLEDNAERSYPTYEEWKLCGESILFLKISGSYPTYEEWKQNKDNR